VLPLLATLTPNLSPLALLKSYFFSVHTFFGCFLTCTVLSPSDECYLNHVYSKYRHFSQFYLSGGIFRHFSPFSRSYLLFPAVFAAALLRITSGDIYRHFSRSYLLPAAVFTAALASCFNNRYTDY